MSHRPLEVDVEADGSAGDGEVVGAQHGGDLLAEGAALRQVDLVLEVLEAHAELGAALAGALSAARHPARAAVAVDVVRAGVVELLEPDLEDSLGAVAGGGEGGQLQQQQCDGGPGGHGDGVTLQSGNETTETTRRIVLG